MAVPTFQLRRVNEDGTFGPYLNDYTSFRFSDVWNSISSMQLLYPDNGEHRAEYLDFDSEAFNEVAIWSNGQELPNGRFLLDEVAYDEIEPSLMEFTGAGMLGLTEWVKLWFTLASTETLNVTGSTGAMLSAIPDTFVTRWSAELNPPFILQTGWTNTLDSGGVAWPNAGDVTLNRGYTWSQLIGDLQKQGDCWIRCQGREVEAFGSDYGVDRTIGVPQQVILRAGAEILSCKVRQSGRSIISAASARVSTTVQVEDSSAAAYLRDNMIREECLADNNNSDFSARVRELDNLIAERKDPTREITVSLSPVDAEFQLFLDYFPGDWIWLDVGKGKTRYKIMQGTLDVGESGQMVGGTLTLNNFFEPLQLTNRRHLRYLRLGREKLPG